MHIPSQPNDGFGGGASPETGLLVAPRREHLLRWAPDPHGHQSRSVASRTHRVRVLRERMAVFLAVALGSPRLEPPVEFPSVAVVAAGTMAEAIVEAAIDVGWPRSSFTLTHRRSERRRELRDRLDVTVLADDGQALSGADAFIIGVPPQQLDSVLHGLSPAIRSDQLFVSIAAALDLPWLQRRTTPGLAIVRAVPSSSTRVRKGLVLLSGNEHVGPYQWDLAERLLGPTGDRVVRLVDEQIDIATGIGPALTPYCARLAERLVLVGVSEGLSRSSAEQIVTECLAAAALMLRDSGLSPGEIVRTVATPEGLTVSALQELEDGGALDAVEAAARRMVTRSQELRL